ncbi:unnamed protein product [Owenia fusiformis]|uniref:Uncharacterized protein n=1 Tax=Owenia fusiformis TaxID=6347 RepID=A0A8J1TMT7_OWEFU|nr:unnamed protein product [Owenia fusiformis]
MSAKVCNISRTFPGDTLPTLLQLVCYNGGSCPKQLHTAGFVTSELTCRCWPGFSGKGCEIDVRALWGITIATCLLLAILLILVALWFVVIWKRTNELIPSKQNRQLPGQQQLKHQQTEQRHRSPLNDWLGQEGPNTMPPGMVHENAYAAPNEIGRPQRENISNWASAGARRGSQMESPERLLKEMKDLILSFEMARQRHNRAF